MCRTLSFRLSLALAAVISPVLAHAQSSQVRISQVFAHGGSLAAQPRADFVELFNAGTTPVVLTGWTIQVAQPTSTNWSVIGLSGAIGPRQYYLIQTTPNLTIGANLPAPDAGPANIDLPQTGGKIALVMATTPISGRPVCPFPSTVIDFLGYGNADQRTPCGVAGTTFNNAPAPGFTTALARRCDGKVDIGSSLDVFELRTPAPRNSASPPNSNVDINITPSSPTLLAFPGQTVTLNVSASVSACAGGISSVTANLSPLGGASSVNLPLLSGTQYQTSINLAALNVQPGSYAINLSAAATRISDRGTGKVTLLVRPFNDDCSAASVVPPSSLPASFTVNNDGAQPDVDIGACTTSPQGDFGVWYTFTPAQSGVLCIEQTSAQSSAIALFTGSCAAPVGFACSDVGQLSANVQAGTPYLVLVARSASTPQTAPPLAIRFSFSTVAPNDGPCQAVPLVLDVPQTGNNSDATGLTDGPLVSCSGSPIAAVKGVWYVFTPAQSGLYRISTCGSPIDTDLAVFTLSGCPAAPNFNVIASACAALGCTGGEPGPGPGLGSSSAALIDTLALDAGIPYAIRVTSENSPLGGPFRILISRVITGACCNFTSGACTISTTGACASGLTYLGNNTTCGPSTCTVTITGACCNYTTGACTLTTTGVCPTGQTFLGADSACTPALCIRNNDECVGAIPIQLATPAFGSTTTATTSASLPTFQCGTVNGSDGADVFFSFVPPSTTTYLVSLCGSDFDTVVGVHTACPATLANRLACNDDAEPACAPSESLSSRIRSVLLNAGVTYYIRVSGFNAAAGRVSIEVNQAGLCCRGATCTTLYNTPQACAASAQPGVGARFVAAVSDCNLPGIATFPCCHADFNKSGAITPQDLFDYLNAWFLSSPFAKVGGDGTQVPVVQDIFDFVNAWFLGGC